MKFVALLTLVLLPVSSALTAQEESEGRPIPVPHSVDPSEITLRASPINGIEIGMNAITAFEVLSGSGFTQVRNLGRTDTQTRMFHVHGPDFAVENVAYMTFERWERENIEILIAWTGADPRGDHAHREFNGDGKIWRIERREILAEPSSFEAVWPVLQNHFGFDEVNCTGQGWEETRRHYAIYVGDSGTSGNLVFPDGIHRCHDMWFAPEASWMLRLTRDFSIYPATSLQIQTVRQPNGSLLSEVTVALSAPAFLLEESGRFARETNEALHNRGPIGSGISDF